MYVYGQILKKGRIVGICARSAANQMVTATKLTLNRR